MDFEVRIDLISSSALKFFTRIYDRRKPDDETKWEINLRQIFLNKGILEQWLKLLTAENQHFDRLLEKHVVREPVIGFGDEIQIVNKIWFSVRAIDDTAFQFFGGRFKLEKCREEVARIASTSREAERLERLLRFRKAGDFSFQDMVSHCSTFFFQPPYISHQIRSLLTITDLKYRLSVDTL